MKPETKWNISSPEAVKRRCLSVLKTLHENRVEPSRTEIEEALVKLKELGS